MRSVAAAIAVGFALLSSTYPREIRQDSLLFASMCLTELDNILVGFAVISAACSSIYSSIY
ncbi:hypothetical protein Tcan_18362 [Toxocara canis]|uniref:Uncharacterized protein n=1 Tax=Toxocara canis TaxID=6265 RepID=A0A0B2V8P6_TOXCA|nr:hypothetical protein Tcan_18362 [Toxocara canis]